MIDYILSVDFGSTLTKYLIMKIENDNCTIVKKDYINQNDVKVVEFDLINILKQNNIDINDHLKIVCTGAKAFSKENKFIVDDVYNVPEFTALSYGTLLPLNIKEALIASVGTGTSFIYSDISNVEHISGTAMGGGVIESISKYLFNENDILKMIERIENIDIKNIDTYIYDLVPGDDYENLEKNLTASNLTKLGKNSTKEEFALGLINMICQNIGIEAINSKKIVEFKYGINHEKLPIIFTGGITTIELIKKFLDKIAFDLNEKFDYIDNGMHTLAIGAYEYYLIKIRENC